MLFEFDVSLNLGLWAKPNRSVSVFLPQEDTVPKSAKRSSFITNYILAHLDEFAVVGP